MKAQRFFFAPGVIESPPRLHRRWPLWRWLRGLAVVRFLSGGR